MLSKILNDVKYNDIKDIIIKDNGMKDNIKKVMINAAMAIFLKLGTLKV